MMKNKFSILLVSAVFIGSIASASTFALGNGFVHDHKSDKSAFMSGEKAERFMIHKFRKMAKHLELTDEQREQAKALYQQAKAENYALKESLQSYHQQSKALIMADNFDEQAFLDLQNQFQASFAQIELIKAKTKHSFMQILTEEQKEKVKNRQESRGKDRHFSQ